MKPVSLRVRAGFALIAAIFVASPAGVAALAATGGKSVPTETIIVPGGDKQGGADPIPQGQSAVSEPIPTIEYDFAKLPPPVARTRSAIIDAASTGEPEKLRPVIKENGEPPLLGDEDNGDPIAYLKSLSGDEGGREILAILIEVLQAGYVHVDVGTPDEAYVWPYFARMPIEKLTAPQLVELFKLVYAGDYEDMKAAGAYTWYRAAIGPDGSWLYFISGD